MNHDYSNPLDRKQVEGFIARRSQTRPDDLRRAGKKSKRSYLFKIDRQPDRKHRSPRLGIDQNLAPVPLHHDIIADVQAQAGAFARRFGGEERVEQLVQMLRRDAGPAILDLDGDPAGLCITLGADDDLALPAERLDGVVDDVRPHLI
jgi:hypothetical protein